MIHAVPVAAVAPAAVAVDSEVVGMVTALDVPGWMLPGVCVCSCCAV